jgi:hypothetical protein
MAANDIQKLTLHMGYHGSSIQTSAHFRNEDAGGTPAGLAAHFRDNALDTLLLATVGEVTYQRITVEQIASGIPPSTVGPFTESAELALAGGTVGALVGEGMIGQGPAVLGLRTGIKGRRYRGRMFLSGAPEGSAALGLWSAGQLALWQAFAADLVAHYGAGGASIYTMVVWSPQDLLFIKKDGTPAPRVGNIASAVTGITVAAAVKTLRRRAVGVGR